ncbi:MAG: hypothetical protein CSA82_01540 [Actinobacteria bacterium]|nr:MAG: hypothetical protein CSA82_01540 [Actinomycetota bacterium]
MKETASLPPRQDQYQNISNNPGRSERLCVRWHLRISRLKIGLYTIQNDILIRDEKKTQPFPLLRKAYCFAQGL